MSFLPPSQDQQLRAIREESGENFVLTHIDTCLSCYLQDHHNRDGELLLGVFIDGSATIGDVLDGLADEYRQIGWELGEDRLGFDYDKGQAAIDNLRQSAEESGLLSKPFDSSIDVLDPETEEERDLVDWPQAWFLIHWEVPCSD